MFSIMTILLMACEQPRQPKVEPELVPSPSMTVLGVTLGVSSVEHTECWSVSPNTCPRELPPGISEVKFSTVNGKVERMRIKYASIPCCVSLEHLLYPPPKEVGMRTLLIEKFGPPSKEINGGSRFHRDSDGAMVSTVRATWNFTNLTIEYEGEIREYEESRYIDGYLLPAGQYHSDFAEIETPVWVDHHKQAIEKARASALAEKQRLESLRL